MATLTDLGFMKGVLFEVIVSTYNTDGTANAAPMGVVMQDEETISLNIFNSSITNRNLVANRFGIVNLTSNIDVFYKTTFKEANPNSKLPQEWFMKAETVNAPKLRLADATVDFAVNKTVSYGDKTSVLCNVTGIAAEKKYPTVYCRAMSLTLEAIIHATRVKAFIEDKKDKEAGELLEIIHCNDVINRVAPNSAYTSVMAELLWRIDSWRNRQ